MKLDILWIINVFVVFQMAFMAMKKNLDERARKKGFDEIFDKFDRNKNGLYHDIDHWHDSCMQNLYCNFWWSFFPGTMYVKDFLRELKMQDIKVSDSELEKICKIADKTGRVKNTSLVIIDNFPIMFLDYQSWFWKVFPRFWDIQSSGQKQRRPCFCTRSY